MSENFEQMLDDYSKTIRNGEVVEGTVIDVKPDEIVLNIGYKADGILTRNEYSNDNSLDLTTVVSPGDTMEVKVLKVNDGEGQVLLTYKRLAAERVSEVLQEAFDNETVLTGTVSQVLDGGLSVIIDDTRIFIPASLVSDMYERDLTKYQDQEIQFVLTEFNPRRRRVIGNRKKLLLEEKAKRQEELLARIHVGDVIEGTVKNITDFGAFIDLGGADGLLHISEMSWGRVDNPRKLYKVGDTVRVFIKDIHDTKIALSVKFPEENPWNAASDQFKPGTVIKGKVARMTDFGAFVELVPGVDALLHVSQISREHVDKPSDVLSIGQEIEAKIVDFNAADHKISLSMKALAPAPAPKEKEPDAAVYASQAAEEISEEAGVMAQAVAEAEAAMEAEAAEEAAEEIVEEADEAAEAVEEVEEALEEEVAEEVAAEEEALEEAVEEAVSEGDLSPEEAEEVIEEAEEAIEAEAVEEVAEAEEVLEEVAAEAVIEDAEEIVEETEEALAEEEEELEEAAAEVLLTDAAAAVEEAAEAMEEAEAAEDTEEKTE